MSADATTQGQPIRTTRCLIPIELEKRHYADGSIRYAASYDDACAWAATAGRAIAALGECMDEDGE